MIITRHLPEGEPRFTGITVTLNGIPVDPPLCRVSAFPYNTPWPGRQRPLDQTEEAAFLGFEADEPVTLHIRWAHPVRELTVRPLARGVRAVPDGNTATVTLPAPGAYTVEADGYHQALHVFFDPIRDFPAVAQGKAHILSFGPGVHEIGCMDLESDTAVLIDRDAYLYGSFRAVCAENIDIFGYGVIDGSREVRTDESRLLLNDYTAPLPADRENILRRLKQRHVLDGILRFYRCRHIRVEGPTLRDAATFAVIPAGCEDVTLENLKTIGMWRYNADGIDLFNCRDVRIRNCFLRNFDDCVVIKGIVGWDTTDNADILVEGCVVWCDWGRNLELGAETNAPAFWNILFRNCDCIHGSTALLDIQHHNRADIGQVTFEDIRVEYTKHQLPDVFQNDMDAPYPTDTPVRHPLLFCLPIYRSGLFAEDGLNGRIHDITFRNIRILTDSPEVPVPESAFLGLDAEHTVERICIAGVTCNGKRLATREELRLHINEFVRDVTILP